MLNALFDKVSTFFAFSKSVLISSCLPLLIGIAVNVVLAYAVVAWFRDFIDSELPPAATVTGLTIAATLAFLALLVATYVLSALSAPFRDMLIGVQWPVFIAQPFKQAQYERFRDLQKQIEDVQRMRRDLNDDGWRDDLQRSRKQGLLRKYCYFAGLQGDAALAWKNILDDRRNGRLVRLEPLHHVKNALDRELAAANVEFPNTAAGALQELLDEFYRLLEYAVNRAAMEERNLLNQRAVRFASHDVAPTTAGNIALTILSYGADRYEFDVELMWTRLQKAVQTTDKDFFAVLQDAKTQLDFAVTTFWILAGTSMVWIIALPFLTQSVPLFVAAAVVLPLGTAGVYRLSVISYHAFADQIRAALDLFRFDLMKALRLPYPTTIEDERKLWRMVSNVVAYAGKDNLTYDQHGVQ